MPRSGKHIHRLNGLQEKATICKELHIPGQGGWIAGNIDQPFCAGIKNGVYHLGVAALARWIDGETVQFLPLRHDSRQGLLSWGTDK